MNESAIVAAHLEWLALRRIFAWRNNTGAVKSDGRWIRYGQKGSGDILGLFPVVGLFFAVECKTEAGRQRKEQKLFEQMVTRSGGVYILSRSTEQLERTIRQDPRLAAVPLDL